MARPGPKVHVTDDELLLAVAQVPGPFATAVEVAELVDLSPEQCRKRMKRLAEEGLLNSKKAGSAIAYWRV